MGDFKGAKFNKNPVIGAEELSDKGKDKRFTAFVVILYRAWELKTFGHSDIGEHEAVEVHHLKRKKPHPELRFKPSNAILLTRAQHIEAHRAGWTDPPERGIG